MWSDRENYRLQELLAPHLKTCLICDAKVFGIQPHPVILPALDLQHGWVAGQGYVMVLVTCEKCGASQLFHASTLGMEGTSGTITVDTSKT